MIMRHEIRERWVEALRSGRYRKTRNLLGRRNANAEGQCALGVLCELAVLDGVTERREIPRGSSADVAFAYGGSVENLPVEVMGWAGLDSVDPYVVGEDGDTDSIAGWNDASDLEFDEIAKLIDADPDRKSDTL